ncbi:cytochrome C2 [Leuconostoc litchii]|uniref:M15 family metallopeptidase n=1 Tax=Leuconostoc litchii TaxID=1981069 RepID=UPI0023E91407|nr:M15 family metallopeptidase [Leuconostoc litchii]GMA69658.1 cytochrome C2 [Leuconostoc litchii]
MISLSFLVIIIVGSIAFYSKHPHSKKVQSSATSLAKTTKEQSEQLPQGVKSSDWNLLLVNKNHIHQSEIRFDQATVDSKQIDKRIEQPLAYFREAAKKAGYATILVSGYRSIAYQTTVYNNSISQYEASGMSTQEAKELTESVIQVPGASEHHTGQAIDLAGADALAAHPSLESAMDQFKSQQWLIKHAPEFGFILRYPSDNQSIKETGIDYESWHFRYVGIANAAYITQHHMTLESYINILKKITDNTKFDLLYI